MLSRRSPEERAAQDRELRDTWAAAAQARKETSEREAREQQFQASPAGRARDAFERGDRVFQYSVDVVNTQSIVVPMVTAAGVVTATADPTVILNSVCDEGWDLVNGSFVFVELGAESRDKFLASGQQVAVRGTVMGYYLFRRCEANRAIGADE